MQTKELDLSGPVRWEHVTSLCRNLTSLYFNQVSKYVTVRTEIG